MKLNQTVIKQQILCIYLILFSASALSAVFYLPDEEDKQISFGNACTSTLYYHNEKIANGAYVRVGIRERKDRRRLVVIYLLEEKVTLIIDGGTITVDYDNKNEKQNIEISYISTGHRGLQIPVSKFKVGEKLLGTNKYAEQREPYGPLDKYILVIKPNLESAKKYTIELPEITVNDIKIKTHPIKFTTKEAYELPCFQ